MALLTALTVYSPAPARAQAAQPHQKRVKDQGEYDLYNSVLKETDPAKKLQYLNTWTEKYPDTDFKEERLQLYNQLNQPAKVVDLGSQLLAKDPNNLTASYLVIVAIQKVPSPTADQVANAEKAARGLVSNIDNFFAPEKKPASTSEADWKTARNNILNVAKATLVWLQMRPGVEALQKKDYEAAEQVFTKVVQENPNSAQASYSLGSAIISQRKPEKFPLAIYEIARAAAMEPANGGLDEATRKQVDAYLTKIYTSYHGPDEAGLQQLKQQALASPLPPADFKLKTSAEIAAEKEEEFRKSNPQLALWMGIRKELTGANGEQYFDANLKNAAVPKLKGKLVDAKPATRSKELLVAISDATNAEVTLKLDAPLTGKPELGTEIEFEGVPSAFSKDPFMLTMDCEKAKITGLKVTAPAPVRRPPARRKAATKG
ncbi:MAG TPA: hypothetical protein VFA33_24895 [Bryobacteraceae bacterium]|nr:hypothetical protein [Bryobacteraceae bacterium]